MMYVFTPEKPRRLAGRNFCLTISYFLKKMVSPVRKLNNQHGAVLLMVLVSVTLLGLMAGIAGSSWQTIMQRSKEVDLIWKGNQIRRAIGSYYELSSGKGVPLKKFPESLDDLLLDPRSLEVTKHLRHLYPDPLTAEEWEIINAPNNRGIMGVRSRSTRTPMKQADFLEENKSFIGQQTYQGWTFIYLPKKRQQKVQQQSTKAQSTPAGGIPTN